MAQGQKEKDGKKYVAIGNGKMFDPGTAHDYSGASWRESEMCILGAADTGTANFAAAHDAVANPQSVIDGARHAADAAQALLDVANALPEISKALSDHWTGVTATAFMGALTKLHTGIIEQYNVLTGQPSGRGDLSWVLMDVGNALDQAQHMVREIDSYYAHQALRLGAPVIDAVGGGQLVAISRTPGWGDTLVQWMTEDMRQVMQQLANRYVEDSGNVQTTSPLNGPPTSGSVPSSSGSSGPRLSNPGLSTGTDRTNVPLSVPASPAVLPTPRMSGLSLTPSQRALTNGLGSGSNSAQSGNTPVPRSGTIAPIGAGSGSGSSGAPVSRLGRSDLIPTRSGTTGVPTMAAPGGMGGVPLGGFGPPGGAGSSGSGRRSSGVVSPVSRFPGGLGGGAGDTDPIATRSSRLSGGLTAGKPGSGARDSSEAGASAGGGGLPMTSLGGGGAPPPPVAGASLAAGPGSGAGIGAPGPAAPGGAPGLSRPSTGSASPRGAGVPAGGGGVGGMPMMPVSGGGPGRDSRKGDQTRQPGPKSAFPGAVGTWPGAIGAGDPDQGTATTGGAPARPGLPAHRPLDTASDLTAELSGPAAGTVPDRLGSFESLLADPHAGERAGERAGKSVTGGRPATTQSGAGGSPTGSEQPGPPPDSARLAERGGFDCPAAARESPGSRDDSSRPDLVTLAGVVFRRDSRPIAPSGNMTPVVHSDPLVPVTDPARDGQVLDVPGLSTRPVTSVFPPVRTGRAAPRRRSRSKRFGGSNESERTLESHLVNLLTGEQAVNRAPARAAGEPGDQAVRSGSEQVLLPAREVDGNGLHDHGRGDGPGDVDVVGDKGFRPVKLPPWVVPRSRP